MFDNPLACLTRQSVITLAKDFGINVNEKDITYEEACAADETFFTGTAVEITPITKIDSHIIGNGLRGPITKKLQDMYYLVVSGQSDKYNHWLSYVNE